MHGSEECAYSKTQSCILNYFKLPKNNSYTNEVDNYDRTKLIKAVVCLMQSAHETDVAKVSNVVFTKFFFTTNPFHLFT